MKGCFLGKRKELWVEAENPGRQNDQQSLLCGFERDANQRGGAWETQLGAMADGVRLPGPFISFVFTASQWVLCLVEVILSRWAERGTAAALAALWASGMDFRCASVPTSLAKRRVIQGCLEWGGRRELSRLSLPLSHLLLPGAAASLEFITHLTQEFRKL